ncbi:uncharacterized protein LAESUDRAFT_737744 [Laetiporus sulphureus 93-53]|uniref:Phospholipase/carboxylesterase/thioesterase domain-containing protein n=1 Tax=Laetiporus sulphureus 93-53 TaxID=1314785 RepID=A0A165DIL5_9APHY|nr:uncharacterized protein LAESUDRAFT_737744 [Laetiporus sulphureus 93-53]KZT04962.1 hypothetical protein LAESUDRAFT_737744 [Laetiporus sulphureus 93-53]
MFEIHLRESAPESSPRTKPPPRSSSIPVPFTYNPSDDGTDENLLILLHGLGDTQVPFGKLGLQLKLPQTATLALRAPEQIPFLYEQAFEWYTSFDPLGDLLAQPNPTPALDLLSTILTHLISDCGWAPQLMHFFGFAQGGTVASEFALKWWKAELANQQRNAEYHLRPLGTVVSVSGPLLSYPTLSKLCPTPLLLFHRPPPADSALPPGAIASFKKGFSHFIEVKMGGADGMPRSKDEWEPIMHFWSEQLSKRPTDGLYEVMSGIAPM